MDGGVGYDTLMADRAGENLSNGECVKITLPGGDAQDNSWSCRQNSASRVLRSVFAR